MSVGHPRLSQGIRTMPDSFWPCIWYTCWRCWRCPTWGHRHSFFGHDTGRSASSCEHKSSVPAGKTPSWRYYMYMQHQWHMGNSLILFYPGSFTSSSAVPGSIEYIFRIPNGCPPSLFTARFLFQMGPPTHSDIILIFLHNFIHLLPRSLELVEVDWVLAHYAHWQFSDSHAVVLSLSQVCKIHYSLSTCWIFTVGLRMYSSMELTRSQLLSSFDLATFAIIFTDSLQYIFGHVSTIIAGYHTMTWQQSSPPPGEYKHVIIFYLLSHI
jgi:hypothetical protein